VVINSSPTSWLAGSPISISISDSNIPNCNKRFVANYAEGEEVSLWELAKNIGVQCLGDEEHIRRKFRDMEVRDQRLCRTRMEEKEDCGS